MPNASRRNGDGDRNETDSHGEGGESSDSENENDDDNDDDYDDYDDDDNDNDNDNDNDDDYISSSEEDDDGSNRTLLFLCEEGQLDIALKRVREWDELCPVGGGGGGGGGGGTKTNSNSNASSNRNSNSNSSSNANNNTLLASTIRKEILRRNPTTGNTCLHEILAGGTSGRSAPELAERLIRRCGTRTRTPRIGWDSEQQRQQQQQRDIDNVFLAQPRGSHGRTILHWCAWGRAALLPLTKSVVGACPEALLVRDFASHGSRIPAEIAERYWPGDPLAVFLRTATESFLVHRVRACIRLCVRRYFGGGAAAAAAAADDIGRTKQLQQQPRATAAATAAASTGSTMTPFHKADRRIARLAPRAWFVASVLGYAIQREMNDLETRILSFVGSGARMDTAASKHKRNAKAKAKPKPNPKPKPKRNPTANPKPNANPKRVSPRKRRKATSPPSAETKTGAGNGNGNAEPKPETRKTIRTQAFHAPVAVVPSQRVTRGRTRRDTQKN